MADEPEAVAELEAPAIEQPADVTDEPAVETIESEEIEVEAVDPDLEEIEVEYNGKKYKTQKGLEAAIMKDADYTRKTQETAAEKRELAAAKQALAQQSQANEAELQARAGLHAVKQQLEGYQNVDWNAWEDSDPLAAQRGFRHFQQLQMAHGELDKQVAEMQRTKELAAQQSFAKREQETIEFAKAKIPGWTPEMNREILAFAEAKGIAQADLKAAINPTIYNILNLARIGEKSLQRQAAPKPAIPSVVQPLVKVAAKNSPPARKALGDMSIDEYIDARKRGVGG
jgi:hypothetical protein